MRALLWRVYDALFSQNTYLTILAAQSLLTIISIGFRTPSSNTLIGEVWQVHAAFVSIGFAGLAIAFQVLGEPPLSAGSARGAIVKEVRFNKLLFHGLFSSLLIGVLVLYSSGPVPQTYAFAALLLPSVFLVGAAYARLASLYADPHYIEELTLSELYGRVDDAAKAAALQAAREHDSLNRLSAARGVVAGNLPREGTNAIRRVKYQGPDARVGRIDVGPLVHAADYLAWSRLSSQPSLSNYFTYDYPRQFAVLVRDGQYLRFGDPLYESYAEPPVGDDVWTSVTQRVMDACHIETEPKDRNPERWLQLELGSLQDAMLAAIGTAAITRVERGYGYYDRAILHALDTASREPDGLQDARWFRKQVWEIDEAAASSSDRVCFVAIESAQSTAYTALRRSNLSLLELACDRLQHLWISAYNTRVGNLTIVEYLLVVLQNLTEFAIPHYDLPPDSKREAARLTLTVLVSGARSAYDAGDLKVARRIMHYTGLLHDLGSRRDLPDTSADINAGLCAILAWLLFAREHRGSVVPITPDDFPFRFAQTEALSVLRLVSDTSEWQPWRTWEVEDSLPLQAQVLTFSQYLKQAVLYLLIIGRLELVSSSYSEGDRHLLQGLLDAQDGVREVLPDVTYAVIMEGLVEQLHSVLERLDRQRGLQIAATPIDPVRWTRFGEGVRDTMANGPSLRSYLDLTNAQPTASGTELKVLGIKVRVPRDFFVASHLFARSEDLGRQFGAAMLRRQDSLIVEILSTYAVSHQIAMGEVERRIALWTQDLQAPAIIHFGDDAIEAVLDTEPEADSATLHGIPAFSAYSIHRPTEHLVIIDRAELPHIRFAAEDREGMTVLPDVQTAIGIEIPDVPDTTGQAGPTVVVEVGQSVTYAVNGLARFVYIHGAS